MINNDMLPTCSRVKLSARSGTSLKLFSLFLFVFPSLYSFMHLYTFSKGRNIVTVFSENFRTQKGKHLPKEKEGERKKEKIEEKI